MFVPFLVVISLPYPLKKLYELVWPIQSQCLLGLTGFGIEATNKQVGTPLSRFLALLGLMSQKTRTAEGIVGLVRVLVNDAQVVVSEFYPIWQSVNPSQLGGKEHKRTTLDGGAILGARFRECNQTVHIAITPQYKNQIADLLPGGQLHCDLLALLRAYLGYQVDAKMTLYIQRQFLPRSQLISKNSRLGQTSSFTKKTANGESNQDKVAVNLGRYSGISYAA
ncbi:hypothetical protein A9G43_00610 [Gilliamella sp. Occ3-1]|nr:hypothetical protein A9G43_00610 [Gilliamella apicola]